MAAETEKWMSVMMSEGHRLVMVHHPVKHSETEVLVP
jgi:hypothetical protein